MTHLTATAVLGARQLDQRVARPSKTLGRAFRLQCTSSLPGRKSGQDTNKGKPQAVSKTSDFSNEAAGTSGSAPQGLARLTNLASTLLMNAASLLEERGVAHCLNCKGLGTVECKACKGSGVVPMEKVQQHSVRRLVSSLESKVGLGNAVMHDNDWQVSNRCRKCHGKGRCMCPQCQGSGRRGE